MFTRSSIPYLIAICTLLFAIEYNFLPLLHDFLPLYYPENEQFGYWQFLTHVFMHGSLMHLLFNMYGLWAFGGPLEKVLGVKFFLYFFFAAGIGSGLIYSAVNYFEYVSMYDQLMAYGMNKEAIQVFLESGMMNVELIKIIPEELLQEFYSTFHAPAVGASGAIYGILVAFAMCYPNVKMILIFIPYPIPAKIFMPLLITCDLFFGLTRYSIGGLHIAHFAHIGGAIIGLLIISLWILKCKKMLRQQAEDGLGYWDAGTQ